MIKNKLLYLFAVLFLFLCSHQIIAQDMGNINFINTIADKQKVTFEDTVKFFIMIIGEKPEAHNQNLNLLKNEEIIFDGEIIKKNAVIKRGLLASMIARKLYLSDSLLYLLVDIDRFALRACIAEDIMQHNTSIHETISGGELIEIMTALSVQLESGRIK